MYDWKLESLRLTTFLENEVRPKVLEELLTKIAGAEPTVQKGPVSFRGFADVGELQIQLVWQPGRIDWFVTGVKIDASTSIGGIEEIGRLTDKYFSPFLTSPECPNTTRLAFGVSLFQPAADVAAANKFLGTLLKLLKIPENTGDLLYRVNRPKNSDATGLLINRLGTWSVVTRQTYSMHMPSPISKVAVSPQPSGDAMLTCRLELDINTEPKAGLVLNHTPLEKVFQDLRARAIDLIHNGDLGE